MRLFLSISLMLVGICLVTSCKNVVGDKAETSEAADALDASGTEFVVDIASSKVFWVGRKPTSAHNGTIGLSEGTIYTDGEKINGGSFTIDMKSIEVLDLEGDRAARLADHLKGTSEGKEDHFFNVAQFPTAKFEITKISELQSDEDANSLVYGNLTLRDSTKQIGFKANINISSDSISVVSPSFLIDRSEWGVKYKSKKFFDDLADNFILDDIGLSIELTASK